MPKLVGMVPETRVKLRSRAGVCTPGQSEGIVPERNDCELRSRSRSFSPEKRPCGMVPEMLPKDAVSWLRLELE